MKKITLGLVLGLVMWGIVLISTLNAHAVETTSWCTRTIEQIKNDIEGKKKQTPSNGTIL